MLGAQKGRAVVESESVENYSIDSHNNQILIQIRNPPVTVLYRLNT